MFSNTSGLGLRPMRPSDAGFVESLYRTTRNGLRLIEAESGFVDHLIDMQYQAQTQGYGDMFPDAMHMIIEHQGSSIGRVIIDFGRNDVRIVDIAFYRRRVARDMAANSSKASSRWRAPRASRWPSPSTAPTPLQDSII